MSGAAGRGSGPRTVRVKICGMTRAKDVVAAVDMGADAVGFIVDVEKDTEREVDAETAAELANLVPPFVSIVLVTMADPETAADLAKEIGADTIQFHGGPDPQALGEIDRRTIVAVPPERLSWASRYRQMADAFLADSATPSGAGGTGEVADWEAASKLHEKLGRPVVLAGGLTPSNVNVAIDAVEPTGVDVASGVESEPGVKDPEAMEAFIGHVKYASAPDMQ